MAPASFLTLPARAPKPRSVGLTHVLDPGATSARAADLLGGGAPYVDIWKTGWGTAYVDGRVGEKLAVLADHDVASCLGGTLLEIAWAQGAAEACLAWADAAGFTHVEVSRGTVPMSLDAKHELVRRAADRFVVLTEVGAKDPHQQRSLGQWSDEAGRDRAAGAALVVAEGRQSGTVGIYDGEGSVREAVVDAVVDAVGLDGVVFEAPRAGQQAWFIRRFGPGVNLGNVALEEILSVETLRLGLRSDTAHVSVPDAITPEPVR
ncbi:phosphosulfolactate synthase [Actinomycetospora cinnamomea]|uniref:Phosphosulfolactate synthase n=1 Tax=Actinomycetospora cinnamomea TaxID=663609 RepID=A0A2U1F3Z3_9PSEU|nr:phosphosulfolactate synthase [Actinomycetospora cinnamomea]PVZ06905.1 phosphosulfolactate synthase [Actinomycetospora cinnamomea]